MKDKDFIKLKEYLKDYNIDLLKINNDIIMILNKDTLDFNNEKHQLIIKNYNKFINDLKSHYNSIGIISDGYEINEAKHELTFKNVTKINKVKLFLELKNLVNHIIKKRT